MAVNHPIPPFPAGIDREQFGHWLSGFVDGEGCFRLGFYKKKPTAAFSISLRADDKPILELIRSYLGCGKPIYVAKGLNRGKESPIAMYVVTGVPSLHDIIIPHFQRCPLRAKKGNDFVVWSQAIGFLHNRGNIITYDSRGRKHKGRYRWSEEDLSIWDYFVSTLSNIRQFPIERP